MTNAIMIVAATWIIVSSLLNLKWSKEKATRITELQAEVWRGWDTIARQKVTVRHLQAEINPDAEFVDRCSKCGELANIDVFGNVITHFVSEQQECKYAPKQEISG